MDVEKLADYILGQTNEELLCIGEEENQQIALAMIQQTQRRLDILTHYFDPNIYDTPACCDAFEQVALSGSYSRIRVLIHEPREVVRNRHRVLDLGRKLNSFFQFRKPSRRHLSLQETFLIADGVGVIHRAYADSLKATANFNDAMRARVLSRLFEEIWNHAENDPNLRYLIL